MSLTLNNIVNTDAQGALVNQKTETSQVNAKVGNKGLGVNYHSDDGSNTKRTFGANISQQGQINAQFAKTQNLSEQKINQNGENVLKARVINPLQFSDNKDNDYINEFLEQANKYGIPIQNIMSGGLLQLTQKSNLNYYGGLNVGKHGGRPDIGFGINYNNGSSSNLISEGTEIGVNFGVKNIGVSINKTFGVNSLMATSNNAKAFRIGAGVNVLTGSVMPTIHCAVISVSHGQLRVVDWGQMLNVLNPVAAGMAVIQAFTTQKIDVPRFEAIKPDYQPDERPENPLFNLKEKQLNDFGKKQLNTLAQNLINDLKNNPNEDISLEIGNQFDKSHFYLSKADKQLGAERQEIVKEYLENYLKENNVDLSKIHISTAINPIQANDKRLNIQDNNTNIKIISNNSILNLTDIETNKIALFNSDLVSPVGQQLITNLEKSPQFIELVKHNKLDSTESNLLATFVMGQHILSKDIPIDNILQNVQKEIYDKGITITNYTSENSLVNRTNAIEKLLQDPNNLEFNLPKLHFGGKVNDDILKKEIHAVANYLANMMDSPVVQQALLENVQKTGQPNTPQDVLSILTKEYSEVYLKQKVMIIEIPDIAKKIEQELQTIKKAPMDSLSDEFKSLKSQLLINNKEENNELAQRILQVALQNKEISSDIHSTIVNAWCKNPDRNIKSLVYNQGLSIIEFNASNLSLDSKEENGFLAKKIKAFDKQWDNAHIITSEMNEAMKSLPINSKKSANDIIFEIKQTAQLLMNDAPTPVVDHTLPLEKQWEQKQPNMTPVIESLKTAALNDIPITIAAQYIKAKYIINENKNPELLNQAQQLLTEINTKYDMQKVSPIIDQAVSIQVQMATPKNETINTIKNEEIKIDQEAKIDKNLTNESPKVKDNQAPILDERTEKILLEANKMQIQENNKQTLPNEQQNINPQMKI